MKIKALANVALVTGGTLSLLALAAYLYSHGPAGSEQLISAAAWTAMPVTLAAVSIFLFGSLALPYRFKLVVVGVCFALTAGVYASELYLAGFGTLTRPYWGYDRASIRSRNQISAVAHKYGVTMDPRNRGEVLADLRGRRIDAVPAVMLADILGGNATAGAIQPINTAALLPLGGISSAVTVLCNQTGQYVTYESDEHGFRNPKGIWDSPRADLAAVGQSLAQGYCVPDGKGFVDLMRPHYPVTLNLGMSGESSVLQLAAIREYLPGYAPPVVLWFFSEGVDLHDLYDESTHPFLMRYLEPTFSQHLLSRQSDIDTALRRFVKTTEAGAQDTKASAATALFMSNSLRLFKLWNLRDKLDAWYGINSDDAEGLSVLEQTAHNLLSDALGQANEAVNNWGGTLYFVYLPSWNRYANGPRTSNQEHTEVLNLVKTLHLPIIDVQPAFDAHPDPLSLFPFRSFGHFNDMGNQLVADTLLKSLPTSGRPSGGVGATPAAKPTRHPAPGTPHKVGVIKPRQKPTRG